MAKRPEPTLPSGKKRDKTPPSKPTAAVRRAALVHILAETPLEGMLRGTTPNSCLMRSGSTRSAT